MNLARIASASVGAFAAYFVVGGLSFTLVPSLRNEFLKYPTVYRSQAGIKAVMPIGMVFMFVAIAALAVLYAMLYRGDSSLAQIGRASCRERV